MERNNRQLATRKAQSDAPAYVLLFVWSLMLLGVVGFWGVIIWAIIKLVSHFTG